MYKFSSSRIILLQERLLIFLRGSGETFIWCWVLIIESGSWTVESFQVHVQLSPFKPVASSSSRSHPVTYHCQVELEWHEMDKSIYWYLNLVDQCKLFSTELPLLFQFSFLYFFSFIYSIYFFNTKSKKKKQSKN